MTLWKHFDFDNLAMNFKTLMGVACTKLKFSNIGKEIGMVRSRSNLGNSGLLQIYIFQAANQQVSNIFWGLNHSNAIDNETFYIKKCFIPCLNGV